jgi:ankyrin repeat protein
MAPRSVDGFDGAMFNNSDPHQGMDGHPEGPLLHAASNNHFESLQNMLKQQHPDLNRRDCFGWTALGLAAERGHEAVVMALLQANADVSLHAEDGKTALMIACHRGVVNIVIPLLERGAQVMEGRGFQSFFWS